jgi:hypothetical protein
MVVHLPDVHFIIEMVLARYGNTHQGESYPWSRFSLEEGHHLRLYFDQPISEIYVGKRVASTIIEATKYYLMRNDIEEDIFEKIRSSVQSISSDASRWANQAWFFMEKEARDQWIAELKEVEAVMPMPYPLPIACPWAPPPPRGIELILRREGDMDRVYRIPPNVSEISIRWVHGKLFVSFI